MSNMDFQNVNPLNVRLNFISGNLLPLTSDGSQFPIKQKLYSAFTWLIEVIQTLVLIPGMILVSREKALNDGLLTLVVTVEVFFMFMRIYTRKKLLSQLIQRFNDILSVADDTMKNIVMTTLKPMEDPLRFYWLAGWPAVGVWFCIPFLFIFERNSFFYEDFKMPAVFSKQPFSMNTFLMGNVIILCGEMYIFVKKVGLDVYMIHLIMLLAAQYRYISVKLAAIFRDGNPRKKFNKSLYGQKHLPETDQWEEREMRALCRHYTAVIQLSSMLKKLLSLSLSMIYVNNVLRFCFIGVMLSAIPSMTFVESLLVSTFSFGSVVQFYMLCYCVQQLYDASTTMTNKAFGEKWYEFGLPMKRTFLILIMGNNLECKLSACDKFNLSLPAFMAILNQSYSICLLLLRVK